LLPVAFWEHHRHPQNIPPLENSVKEGEAKSLRQILEFRCSQPACLNCHTKMDPLGFGLENYDAIGHWRNEDGMFPIEASGQLISGRTFSVSPQTDRLSA